MNICIYHTYFVRRDFPPFDTYCVLPRPPVPERVARGQNVSHSGAVFAINLLDIFIIWTRCLKDFISALLTIGRRRLFSTVRNPTHCRRFERHTPSPPSIHRVGSFSFLFLYTTEDKFHFHIFFSR